MSGHSVSRRRTVHHFRCFGPRTVSVRDKHGHGYFTLSYERFLFPLDEFPGEFVILSIWLDGSREGRR